MQNEMAMLKLPGYDENPECLDCGIFRRYSFENKYTDPESDVITCAFQASCPASGCVGLLVTLSYEVFFPDGSDVQLCDVLL